MTKPAPPTVFSLVDPDVLRGGPRAAKPTAATSDSKSPPTATKRKRRRYPRLRRWARITAPIAWGLFIADNLVLNLDTVATRAFPWAGGILAYRFLFVAALLVAIVSFSRSRSFYGSILYVLAYPAVLVFWIIPKLLWKHRSWTALIGIVHVAVGFFGGFRRAVYVWASILLAWALAVTDAAWASYAALGIVALLFLWTAWTLVVQSLKPDKFLTAQTKLFKHWTGKPERFKLPEELQGKLRGDKFDEEDSNTVVDHAANAAVTYYMGHFWADRLTEYMKGRAFYIYGTISILRYYALFVLFLTLANRSLFNVLADQYLVIEPPSLVTLVQYSLATLGSSDVYGFTAIGDGARALAIIGAFLGGAIIPVVVVTLIQGYRYSTTGDSGRRPVGEMRKEADKVADWATESYDMTTEAIASALAKVGESSLFGALLVFSRVTEYDFGLPNLESTANRNSSGRPSQGNQRRSGRGHKGRARSRLEKNR